MIERHSQAGRRSRFGKRRWQFSLGFLFVLTTICAVLLSVYRVFRSFPHETLIFAVVIAIAGLGIVLYIAELYVIGWVVDFLSGIGVPKFHAKTVPLDCEIVGEMLVVQLRDNVATAGQCQAVERQLKQLIAEHHCDFVLDFCHAGNIATSFRGVMVQLLKRARNEAEKLGKTCQPIALPRGDLFKVFEDRQQALETMSQHGGHGWVVLCCVPVGIRAVTELA
jgi:hypothetical protein